MESGKTNAARYRHNRLSDRTDEEIEKMKGLVKEVEKSEEDGRRGLSSERKDFIRSERELDHATVTGENVDWAGQAGAVHDQG